MSPELFDPENYGLKDGRRTERSDCYALGMVVYEVLSGQLPFSCHASYAVVARVLNISKTVKLL
jgi:serine/threonine protein kinase